MLALALFTFAVCGFCFFGGLATDCTEFGAGLANAVKGRPIEQEQS